MTKYDVVIYGATGFAGSYILESLVNSEHFSDVSFAIAGRSEIKLRKVLDDVSIKIERNIRSTKIIIANVDDPNSLADMAKQAKVIINAVGPYKLYGEPVVKAAIENGASHLDISGEPTFLEDIEAKYSELAKKNGVYVVGACGWDSIPCDLGVYYLKKNFNGDLESAETYVQLLIGPKGYPLNSGTYESLVLSIPESTKKGIFRMTESFSPKPLVEGGTAPPSRGLMFKVPEPIIDGWAMPFPGADSSIVTRSQVYDLNERNQRPVQLKTYFRLPSFCKAGLLGTWLSTFSLFALIPFTRNFLLNHPDFCSFNMFKSSGPTEEQIAETKFAYWFVGTGYEEKLPVGTKHTGKPDRKVVAKCKGPDPGYYSTSGCILSSALAIIKDSGNLPKDGGVYTTAAAFGDTKIYDYLKSFDVMFQIEQETKI